MQTFYSGSLKVQIQATDKSDPYGKTVYRGRIQTEAGVWEFDDLASHSDEMGACEDAIAFGSWFTPDNRDPDDTPDWAPAPEVAQAIDEGRAIPPENSAILACTFGFVFRVADCAVIFESKKDQDAFWRKVNAAEKRNNTACVTCGKPVANRWHCNAECKRRASL